MLPTSPQEYQEDSLWQLRSLAIKSRVRLDLDAALRSHQSAMGALLLTFMTQSVRVSGCSKVFSICITIGTRAVDEGKWVNNTGIY